MDEREQLLDELARVYAHAAVDACLLEQEAETATPATSAKGAGVNSNGKDRNETRCEEYGAARSGSRLQSNRRGSASARQR